MCHPRFALASTAVALVLSSLPSCGGTVEESSTGIDTPDAAAPDASKPDAAAPDASKPDAPPVGCTTPNPASCLYGGGPCPSGQLCVDTGCMPSSCQCVDGHWSCSLDCVGGTCMFPDAGADVQHEDASCPGPNPAGCFFNGIGCPAGQVCAHVGCSSSGCTCSGGGWACDDDCGGGTCVYASDASVDGPDCHAIAQSIASQIKGFTCTAVVRLDYSSYSMIGWQLVCGGFKKVDQDAARVIAQSDTGFGTGTALSPTAPSDEHVFYQSPGDFGGVGVVSATSGLSVFGGSIVWAGTGELTWPQTPWNPPLAPDPSCVINAWPKWTGYDLENGAVVTQGAGFDSALSKVFETPLPMGIAQMLYLENAVVLRYPRTVGAFHPANAEWIVLLNAIWLE